MLTKFAEGLGGKLAESWTSNILTPAFVFWAGGLAAWVHGHGWGPLLGWFNAMTPVLQGGLLAVGLLLVAASGAVVQQFDMTVLRLFEGYWPAWLRPLRSRLVSQHDVAVDKAEARLQELALKANDPAFGEDERQELLALDWRLMHEPPRGLRMPTRFGNVLRAAESRPQSKYGLDSVICWPRLWLLLPEGVRAELSGARAALNNAARLCLWGALFLVWTIWSWWAVPVGVLTMLLAYRWMLSSAEVYGRLVESTFDLYRTSLYKSLRWPLPTHPGEEHKMGESLTAYLWRGSDQSTVKFLPPSAGAGGEAEK